jgi:uncharacterized protein YukE
MTSGGMWGMDTDEVTQHAAKMDGGVSAIQGVLGNIGNLLGSTAWFGKYASEFVSDWHGTYTPQLNGVSNALTDNAAVLRQRVQMQEEASGN